jgi:DNA-binding PadR family transcriptional regulator
MTAATAQGYLNAHDGHRRYLSRESFFETLRDRSTDSSIAPSTWLHVVEFEPIAGDRPDGGDRVIRTDGGVPAALTGRNGFRRDLLLALALLERERDGRISGSAIQDRVEGLLDEPVNHGRLYENLDRLADRGLIEKVPEGIDRRTNAYRLTSAGRAALETRLERLADAVGADVRHPVETDGGGA